MTRPDPMAFTPGDITIATPLHIRDMLKADPLGLINSGMLKIRTKEATLSIFKPNSSQKKVLEAVQLQRKKHLPVRILILKSRQMGCSTLAQAVIYSYTSMRANINAFVIADDEEGASYLFKMNETFHEEMQANHEFLTPKMRRASEKKIEFWGKRSAIYVETANNKRAGRKYTIHVLHASEVAFWKSFRETMRGLMQSVPDKPETIVMLESTANGTNDFCKFWRRVSKECQDGKSAWIPVFLSWKDHEEYQRPFVNDTEKQSFMTSLSGRELELQKEFQLTPEQLHWRRWKISNDFQGDADGFEVEFPLSPDQAFKSTAKNVFPEKIIKAHASTLKPPRVRGDLHLDGRKPILLQANDGNLRIFDFPKPGHRYVIGIDSCESASGTDFAACEVIDRTTWAQVATFHARIPPEILAEEAFKLGLFYNVALLAPELNGPGLVTVTKLVEMGYPNLCRRKKTVISEQTGTIAETEEIGWRTDAKSKQIIVREAVEGMRNCLWVINNEQTLDEFSTYVVHDVSEEGHVKYGADEGCHDDRAMAFMIAQHYARNMPDFTDERQDDTPFHLTRATGYG